MSAKTREVSELVAESTTVCDKIDKRGKPNTLLGLDRDESLIFMWQTGIFGNFYDSLFKLLVAADVGNLEALRLGFPEEVNALVRFRTENGWWQHIEWKAQKLGLLPEAENE